MNVTPIFNQVLARHNAQPVEPYVFRVENLDEFLKEAYRIVGHVTPPAPEAVANRRNSGHILRSFTQISNRYDRATFQLRLHHAESKMRAPAIPQLRTRIRNTLPTHNVTRSMRKQSSRCES